MMEAFLEKDKGRGMYCIFIKVKEAQRDQATKERAQKKAKKKAEEGHKATKGKKKSSKQAPELVGVAEDEHQEHLNRMDVDGALATTTDSDTTDGIGGMTTNVLSDIQTDYDADKSMVSSPSQTRGMSLAVPLNYLTHLIDCF